MNLINYTIQFYQMSGIAYVNRRLAYNFKKSTAKVSPFDRAGNYWNFISPFMKKN